MSKDENKPTESASPAPAGLDVPVRGAFLETEEERDARRAAARARIADRTGIDEVMIHDLVHEFYAKVRTDEMLGPIFDARIADWEPHLARMCDFWSSVALMSGRYHGQPMPKHLPLPVDGRHFDRWLELFEQTAVELCPPAAAGHFVDRARQIAKSLEMGIAVQVGQMVGGDKRLIRPELDVPSGAVNGLPD